VVASSRLFNKLSASTPFALLLQDYLLDYVLFHGAIAAVCIAWAVLRLRAVALREPGVELLAGATKRRVSPVSRWRRRHLLDWPLLWKGMVVDSRVRKGSLTWLLRGCGLALLFWPVLHVICSFGRFFALGQSDHLAWLVNDWCKLASSFLGSAMLLVVALRAAGSISRERERQTLDSLLATPLRNRTIILAKWLSCILSPSGWGRVLGAVWVVSLAMGALHPAAIPCWLLAWLIDAAFVAAVGVWFSAVSPTTRRAVLATTGFALTVLLLLLVLAAYSGVTRWVSLETFRLQPPVTFALLAFSPVDYQDLGSWIGTGGLGSWPRIILQEQALGAAAVIVFLFVANFDFRRVTGRREGSAPAAHIPWTIVGSAGAGVDEYEVVLRANWPRRLACGLLFCMPPCLVAGLYLVRTNDGELQLSAILAHLDRTDPGWRLEDIEAQRLVVPDESNSALRSLNVYSWVPVDASSFLNLYAGHPAERRFSTEQMDYLHSQFDWGSATRSLARSLADMPYGRFPVRYAPDGIGTDLGHCKHVCNLANYLHLDAISQAEAGDADGAVRSCQVLVNIGRSIGDEPAVMSQLVRANTRTSSMLGIERILAQGQPSGGALETLQHLLEQDEQEPLFLIALRGERAAFDRFVEAVRRGESTLKVLRADFGPSHWSVEAVQTVMGGSLKAQRAALLDYYTQVIEAARLPPGQQSARFAAIPRPSPLDQPLIAYLILSVDRIGNSQGRALAEERCAIVALAAERFRRANGKWPKTLSALMPEYVSKVPADPFTGKPMLYGRRADGMVIYSVGVDGLDNGGKLDRKNPNPNAAGIDVGLQLWNVDKRRQPFTPK